MFREQVLFFWGDQTHLIYPATAFFLCAHDAEDSATFRHGPVLWRLTLPYEFASQFTGWVEADEERHAFRQDGQCGCPTHAQIGLPKIDVDGYNYWPSVQREVVLVAPHRSAKPWHLPARKMRLQPRAMTYWRVGPVRMTPRRMRVPYAYPRGQRHHYTYVG